MLQRLQQVPGPRTCSRDYSIREPTLAVKAALHQLLTHDDERFFTRAYKALYVAGLPAKAAAERVGHKDPRFILRIDRAIRALFGERNVDTIGSSSTKSLLMEVRHWLKAHSQVLPPDLRAYLLDIEEQLVQRMKSFSTKKKLRAKAGSNVTDAVPGVYAYTYPRYLGGATVLLKIGATRDLSKRIADQRRKTEVPEDLTLVRRFPCDDPFYCENAIHNILKMAGCQHQSSTGGEEWFETTTEHLDAIADSLGLVHRD